MWKYEKTLQYPVHITNKDLRMAKYIITQFGGANGELGATLRYLTQRYTMPDDKGKALLTDIGTEECVLLCCILFLFNKKDETFYIFVPSSNSK